VPDLFCSVLQKQTDAHSFAEGVSTTNQREVIWLRLITHGQYTMQSSIVLFQ